MKERLISIAVIAVLWSALDFLFHNVILMSAYEATANLWRPMAEMKVGLMHGATVALALVFVLIYCQLVQNKSLARGLKLGALVGALLGIAMAGTYAYSPITPKIAVVWFIAEVVKFTVAGAVVGKIMVKELKS